MGSEELLKEVLIVVVLYKKKIKASATLNLLAQASLSNALVLIYDNGPNAQQNTSNFIYHHSATNVGVSGAYNHAAGLALQSNKNWLWLLDDDTEIDLSFLEEAEASLKEYPHLRLLAPKVFSRGNLLSPFAYKQGISKRLTWLSSGLHPLRHVRPINTGMLVHIEAFNNIHGYNPSLPLDFADLDFTDRLAEQVSHFYVVKTRFIQAFSGDEKPKLNQALSRFKRYVEALKTYGASKPFKIQVLFQGAKHALALSVRHKSATFVVYFLKNAFSE